MMKKTKLKARQIIQIALIVLFFILMGFFLRSCLNNQTNDSFIVMSTTDMHGRVWDSDIQTNEPTPINMLAASTIIKKSKEQFGDRTILYDNGDLYQGSLVKTFGDPSPKSEDVKDIDPCTICLDDLKYDGFTLGNHEFNYKYSIIQTNYQYIKENTSLVAANVYEKGTNNRYFKPYITKTVKIDNHFFKIGVIGLENPECSLWDASDYSADVSMHAVENPNADLSYEIKKAQQDMLEADEKCDFVIVSMHNGFFKQDEMKDIKYNSSTAALLEEQASKPIVLGENTENQAYHAIKNTTGIDMFITGHDHNESYSNKFFSNEDGSKDVLVVNGGSTSVTRSLFYAKYNEEQHKYDVSLEYSENVRIDEAGTDESLRAKVRPYIENQIKNYAYKPGQMLGNWISTNDVQDYYTKQTDEVDFINRAQMWAGNILSISKDKTIDEVNKRLRINNGEDTNIQFSGTEIIPDLSITPASENGKLKPINQGEFIYEDAKRMYPEDHYLCSVAVTGQEIKEMLENNAEFRYQVSTKNNGEKELKINGDPRTLVIPYGLNFYYDMDRKKGDRVVIDKFTNGKSFNKDTVYCMMVNSFLLDVVSNYLSTDVIEKRTVINQELNYNGTYIRHILDLYATQTTIDFGGVYPTPECKNNNETPSFWYITY